MTHAATAFIALFDRMPDLVASAVEGLTADQLAQRVDPEANTVAWLVWHLTRVEDDHVSGAAAVLGRDRYAEQAYPAFADRFDLPFPVHAHGFGMSTDDVGRVWAAGPLLAEYHAAVHAKTRAFLADLADDDWDRVVDAGWEPPVTLLDRMTSVANEVAQHVGQAAYVRGLLERS